MRTCSACIKKTNNRPVMTRSNEQENVPRAAAWLVLGVAGGLGLDLCAKQILQGYPLVQFILLRSGIAMLIMLAIAPRFGGYETLRSKEIGWHVVRTLFAIGAMYGFFYGLARMPLVNALTLGYTAPLIMTVLASIFLDETIGWRRWTAVSVGFAGVLIILRPGSGEFSIAAAAVLIAAFCYACQAITARRLSATESTLALSFYVVVGPLVVALAIIDTDTWLSPDLAGWVLLCTAAVASIIAWVGFVNGYRAVSPATLAPLEYIALVGGAIAGFLIWDEVPDRWVVMGAMIIISSGVFVVYRGETRKAEN